MSTDVQSKVLGTTEGALSGAYAGAPPLRLLAAPTMESDRNTLRASIIPLACWRMEDLRFDFGSSLIMPEAKQDFPLLAELIDEHTIPKPVPGQPRPAGALLPPATIFGHADPVGNDDFNKRLSGRRAAVVYGMLTRREEVWEDLYSNKGNFAPLAAGDDWGIRSIQIMLNEMPADKPQQGNQGGKGGAPGAERDADGFPKGLDPTEELGPQPPDPPERSDKLLDEPLQVDGVLGSKTRAAIKRFQASDGGRAAGLAVDGEPGPKTRSALFLAYMDVVCVDGNARPFKMDREHGFVGRGKDAAGKCDYQGCGEFNPTMIFSKAERAAFEAATDKTVRNAENAVNRRVLILLFRPGTMVSTAWPCPRAVEGTAGCKTRFWSDGERRRSPSEKRREFVDTQDTFACRFYQRMTTGSPCERSLAADRVPLRLQIHDSFYQPCPNEGFIATGDGGYYERGQTDAKGMLALKVPRTLTEVVLRYTAKKRGLDYKVTAALVPPAEKDDRALLSHLRNFGFGNPQEKTSAVVVKFQAARGDLKLSGVLDQSTKRAVDELLASDLEPGLGPNRG